MLLVVCFSYLLLSMYVGIISFVFVYLFVIVFFFFFFQAEDGIRDTEL